MLVTYNIFVPFRRRKKNKNKGKANKFSDDEHNDYLTTKKKKHLSKRSGGCKGFFVGGTSNES